MSRGKFIAIEGCDGAGKTTQIMMLKDYLDSKGLKYILTREPGGTRISEKIRAVILDNEHVEMHPVTEALLYVASRSQHVEEVILPHLLQGTHVICDRYVDSNLVYQGHARGLGIDTVWEMNKVVVSKCIPDATLFYDLDPEISIQRRITSGGEVNRLDNEKMEFHKKTREGFHIVAKRFNERYHVIDASQSVEAVFEDTKTAIDNLFGF